MEKRGTKVIVWCNCRYTWIPHYTNHERKSVTIKDMVCNFYGVIENNKLYILDQDPAVFACTMEDSEREYFKTRFGDMSKFMSGALKEILSDQEVGKDMEVTPSSNSYSPNNSYTIGFLGLSCYCTKRDDSLLFTAEEMATKTDLEKVYVSETMGPKGPVQLELDFE